MFLENGDAFLSEMSKMFEKSRKDGGSVFITMKRVDSSKKPPPRPAKLAKLTKSGKAQEPIKNSCLIRCVFKTQKISTNIDSKNIAKFQTAYSSLLRGNFYGLKDAKELKKAETEKGKKGKATQ